jgi:transglutaminase-like putative cysteine protease
MLLACILLINTAGYAVAADNTASVAGCMVEEQCSEYNQCELMNESETGSVDTGKQSSPGDPGKNESPSTPEADETVTESGGLLEVNGTSGSPGSVAVNPENSTGTVRAAGDSAGITSVTIRESAAELVKYIETYGKLPATVSVGGQKLGTAQFLDLMLKDLLKLAGSTVSLTLRTVSNAPNPSGSATGQLSKSAYLKLASSVLKFINSNRRAPNYVSSNIGKISSDNLVYAVARILKFQKDNSRLPNYVTIKKISASTAPTASLRNTSVTIRESAAELVKYIETYGKLPATVSVGGQKLGTAQFLDLMLKDLLKLAGSTVSLTLRTVSNAPNPSGSATGQLSKSAYLKLASSVLKFIDSNRRAPNYVSSTIGKISYDNLVYAVARILKFQKDNSRLPNYVTIKKISASTAPTASLRNRAENDPFTGESTSRYLAATANCQVNDPAIKSLAANLTAGLTGAWDKATAIFNWVRDRISYSFYYNTRYGATGTLKYRTGNCVDHSHLLVALFRAAGLAARYVHGTCTFTSGNTYGHVWAQVLVGDTWYAADATSSKNSLGAVNSWNTATAKIKGIYASLPF